MRPVAAAGPLARASLFALAAAIPVARLGAQGWIVPRPCISFISPAIEPSARPLPARDCRPNITRTQSDVRVELVDRVLRYEVDERFVNRGGTVAEADYLFPLPNGAAFQDLKLSIDGHLVAGETMNADEARRVYETIVRTQRDPALVEWMGHGLVRARVFPLNPGEERRIVIRFQSVAPREGDALRIDYFRGGSPVTGTLPTNATPIRDESRSTFSLDYRPSPELGEPYSPTHQLDVADHDGRREVNVRGDARDVTLLIPVRRTATAAVTMLPYAPGGEDGFALVTVTPPAMAHRTPTPRDVTLVLDVSGSMSGRKIEQARAAGRQLLGTLRPEDRFRLIDFSSDVHTFRDEFSAATPDNLRDAMHYLDALDANGGTNIEGALREAVRPPTVEGRLPLVLFVTDGEPTVGDPNPDHLASIARGGERTANEPRRIFTFGLGSDVNVSLLEQLALDGRGTSQFVRPDESVERMVGVVAARLVDPALTDVRVHADGGVKLESMLPAQPSDIFADNDLVLLARYSGHGPAHIVVEGRSHDSPVHWTSNVDFPDRDRDNSFVARLWATQRVGYLSAEKRQHGGSSEIDDEIRSLGERFGIPTEFTSYLVTEPRFVAATNGMLGTRRLIQPAIATSGGAADLRFEAAKAASAQRSMSNIATLDSLAAAAPAPVPARGMRGATGSGVAARRVDGRTFELRDSVWTDIRFTADAHRTVTTIKPYSNAYFAVLDQLPELRAVFALGRNVAVVGRGRAIVVSDAGVADLAPSALAALVRDW
ncbi:MAG TPA: VIT domain-containing protein [Gemmatimonadaceae bacterium]|nr:VIT domain-containing protein [Gemmatimonadaceae bacterium]